MASRTSLSVLAVMSPIGWFLACVLGVLACMLAFDAPGHKIPWMILGALVIGSMLATIPVVATALAAYDVLGRTSERKGTISWRWVAVTALCCLEALVLPLTLVAAAAEDDTLVVSIPFNLVIVTSAVLLACWPYQRRAAIAICVIHIFGIVIATFSPHTLVDISSWSCTNRYLNSRSSGISGMPSKSCGFVSTSCLIFSVTRPRNLAYSL